MLGPGKGERPLPGMNERVEGAIRSVVHGHSLGGAVEVMVMPWAFIERKVGCWECWFEEVASFHSCLIG